MIVIYGCAKKVIKLDLFTVNKQNWLGLFTGNK